jgi:Luciferase-like monooxygenase/Hemerythrin HHE cation binding domain
MPDYGHDLWFGANLIPSHDSQDATVELAELADQVGLDLVTFQDHPYQPRFFDTWTLLSYVAARTERTRLTANVINLPLRQPAVLARSAASLDILSGGRIELALGAGAFWDAIEAMGGPRRSSGEAIAALDEAIQVIRAIWDVDASGGVRVEGRHYRVKGAKRGPKPAHDMGIWLGAYKPRMLRLTGRVADGWLPSEPYLRPGQLTEGNATIDAAAIEAGRSPRDIRRLLNLGDQISVDHLVELALTEGISGFLLTTGDPTVIQRYADEIAPAVREAVASGRAAPAESGPPSAEPPPARSGPPPAGSVPGGSPPGPVRLVGLGVDPTPDDGVRRSDTIVWDESTRPTRPESSGDARYTDRGRAQAQQLVAVHDHLRIELSQVRDLVEQVRAGAIDADKARSVINDMTLRQNNWTLGAYCASYCRLVTQHHTIEDRALFPYLRARDAELAPVLDRLTGEHKIIHQVLEGLDRALVANLTEPDNLAALSEALDQLSDALLSHLAYEERELLEPIATYEVVL